MAQTFTNNLVTNVSGSFSGASIFCDNQSAMHIVNDSPSYRSPNQAAEEAAEEQGDTMLLKSSLGSLLQKSRLYFHIRRYNFDPGRPHLRTSPKKITESFASLEKRNDAVIFQLQSNHNALDANLSLFQYLRHAPMLDMQGSGNEDSLFTLLQEV
ncbi:hypothetical protein CROQUDRAFT_93252 [Cronartium quercuum f. sp. fusiforme G11]|uniref:Uncharacterized protein n=1 Tax=Cronartium quercuum f. sp. fusiforme G11 TaxID=708437 RepID=A0A9P6TBR5_9BASI|nr:hypothetical protein CROQUDRAFT_93252 [Cronartium quercuum f. sp. fusiforme G11]